MKRCAEMGDLMLEKLLPLQELPIVAEVRGRGLLIGVEFVADKKTRAPFDPSLGVTNRIVEGVFDKGVAIMPGAPGLIDGVEGDHIAISPPFTITPEEVDISVDAVVATVRELSAELAS